MHIKIDQLLERMRIEYEDSIGEVIEPNSRMRDKVEVRAALVNAARPYATLRQLADMVGKKDHSTVVHLIQSHDIYQRVVTLLSVQLLHGFERSGDLFTEAQADTSGHARLLCKLRHH